MTEILNTVAGEQYHIDRARELGLPEGTGKRYDKAGIESFLSASPELGNPPSMRIEFNRGGARHIGREMIGGFFYSRLEEYEKASGGMSEGDDDNSFGLMAMPLFELAHMAHNPPKQPLIEANLFKILGKDTPEGRFDMMLVLLGEYIAMANAGDTESTNLPKKSQTRNQKQIKKKAREYTKMFRDTADLLELNDPERVRQIAEELSNPDPDTENTNP